MKENTQYNKYLGRAKSLLSATAVPGVVVIVVSVVVGVRGSASFSFTSSSTPTHEAPLENLLFTDISYVEWCCSVLEETAARIFIV